MDLMKITVLLLLAPQSQSSMCTKTCEQEAVANIAGSRQQASGLEVEFPLSQTIILDL